MYKGIPLSLIPTCQWQVGTAKPTHKSEQVLPTIRYHKYPVANRQHQPASNGSRGNEHGAGEENHLFSIESEFIGKRAENDPNVNLKFEPHVTAEWPLLSPNGFNGLAEDIKSIAAKYGY